MAYSSNILPRAATYYSLHNANITDAGLSIQAGGYAEIQIVAQMLPRLTAKMLVVVHPEVFADYYQNDTVQVSLSIITTSGNKIEYLISASMDPSGVFNTEINLPEEEYVLFTYRISSKVDNTIYNWELCQETQAELDVTTIIDGVEQSLPRLLYDYNTYAYAVGQVEDTVGLISCMLLDATDLQGHFTISFFATERCNVHVRVKDNEITELFSPQVYTVEKGYASISIPHAYLKKKATAHAFSVTMQCTNGQLSIPVRGVLYTIDGGYLATRLLDAGIDVQDLSIKQLPTDTQPSEIWAVGFESKRLLLKNRAYNQMQKTNWRALKDFGEALEACVEFPASWINRNNSDKYTMETEAYPFVFLVGMDYTLRCYSGVDYEDIFELDNLVTYAAVCEGFNSMYDPNRDQGVVIVYIKKGNVYYRQWAYNTDTEAPMWYPVELLYNEGDAHFVSVHRLPDYRLGILVRHANGTKWYITDRTYVAQAIKTDMPKVRATTLGIATVIDVGREEEPMGIPTLNVFSEENVYHNEFVMTYDYPVFIVGGKSINEFKQKIQVYVDDELSTNQIEYLTIVDNVVTIIFKEGIRGGQTVRIEYNFPFLLTSIYNGCNVKTRQTHEWALPTPTTRIQMKELPSITVSPELNVQVIETVKHYTTVEPEVAHLTVNPQVTCNVIETVKNYKSVPMEHAHVGVTVSLGITVTQVGTSPV